MNLVNSHFSALIGISLGTGCLTKFRLVGPIGISEVLFLIIIFVLFKENGRVLVSPSSVAEFALKNYLLLSTVLILPLVTAIVWLFSPYGDLSAPIYVISFIMGVFLTILLTESIRREMVDLRVVTVWFLVVFIFVNLIAYFFFFPNRMLRFKGFSENPNQLLFYVYTLSLLLCIYRRKLLVFSYPILIFIMWQTKSDAYILSLIVVVIVFVYLRLLYLKSCSLGVNILMHSVIFGIFLYFVLNNYSDLILDTWIQADEGDGRRALMFNALLASKDSFLFGWGAGSFSGLDIPYQGSEAHNTFLDLSMQFGFVYPMVIYGIILATILAALKKHDFLVVAFMVGFMLSGFFHFSGRHFAFWVEISVFWYYIFPNYNNYLRKRD